MGTQRLTASLVVALAMFGMGAPAAQAASQQPQLANRLRGVTPMDGYIARADRALAAANEETEGAADDLKAVIDDPLFEVLETSSQRLLLSTAALLAWRQEQPVTARDLYLRATRVDGNDPDDWYRLAALEQQLGDHMRAAQYMTAFLKRWPELANNINRYFISESVYQDTSDSDARLALLQALFAADWTDRQRGGDDVWRELVLALTRRNALAEAATVAARISEPLVIVKLRSDKRFDAIAESVARLPPVEVAAAQRVDALRRLASENPLRIDLATDLGSALLIAGRDEEALAQSDAVLAAIQAGRDTETFESLEDEVWVMNNRAIALRRLDRLDEAAAELERASRLKEGEGAGANVSQVLNLGAFYCALGRPADALRTIESTGEMSPYGRMVRGSVLHCAALQSGDRARAATALDYLTDHREDGEGTVLEALLRADRLDDAARELMLQLESEASREEALGFVQEFRAPATLPGDRVFKRNWIALRERPDVKAAVARHGRMGKYDIHDPSGID